MDGWDAIGWSSQVIGLLRAPSSFSAYYQNLNPFSSSLHTQGHEEPDDKVENFDSTEDREASEKSKGAPDQTQGCLNCDLVGGKLADHVQ